MTKDEKKECFLRILENIFDDHSEQINFDNCIGFYHYLIDCLEFEKSIPSEDSKFINFLNLIVDFLTSFDVYVETRPEYMELLTDTYYRNNFMYDAIEQASLKDIEFYFLELKQLYAWIKEEFLI